MPNRILKDSIRTSKSVNAMSDFQFRLWAYLITYVDDYGRGSADPELLKGFVFPRRKGVTESTIAKTLAELATMGSILLYEVDGESYLCFPSWSNHQQVRNKVSKFPSPSEGVSLDINCNQMKSNDINCPRNPIQNPESRIQNTKGTRATARFVPPTLEEVTAYVSERGSKVDAKRFFDYFEAANWVDAKGNPVRSWKQKLITWEGHETHQAKTPKGSNQMSVGAYNEYHPSTEDSLEEARRTYAAIMRNNALNDTTPVSVAKERKL